jgi:hypothetical protein
MIALDPSCPACRGNDIVPCEYCGGTPLARPTENFACPKQECSQWVGEPGVGNCNCPRNPDAWIRVGCPYNNKPKGKP